MVVLGICLYLFFIILGLLARRKAKKYCPKNKFIKNLKRLSGLSISKSIFFGSTLSKEYLLFQKLCSGVFIFEKQQKFLECCQVFDRVGIDYFKPILKYEIYGKEIDLKEVFNKLKLIKNLDKKNVSFNLFIFFNNNNNFKPLAKLVKYFKFKCVNVKLYHCCEINYKLLSSINFFNINLNNFCLDFNENNGMKNNSNSVNIKQNKINNLNLSKDKFKKVNGLFLVKDNDVFEFDNFVYDSYYQSSFIENSNFKAEVSKTFDLENNCELFKVTIKNINSTIQTFNCCFGTIFENKTIKNNIYCVTQKKEKLGVISFGEEKKSTNLFGFNNNFLEKDYLLAFKRIELKPKVEVEFYFAVFKSNKFLSENKQIKISQMFNDCWQQYSKIKSTKVLSKNKTLNYLVNEFLPKKIIENSICKGEETQDLKWLIESNFNAKLLDKKLVIKNLNFIFLIKSDLFKTYFNLLYFYFGVWYSGKDLFLNDDKSLILSDVFVSCFKNDKIFKIEIVNKNTGNEVMVNKIKFSNLKCFCLDFVNKDNDIKLIF